MRLDPAYSIIAMCGGAAAVARVTRRSVTRVYRWTYPEERGGTGGIIPMRPARKIKAHFNVPDSEFLKEPSPVKAKPKARAA